MVIKHHIHVKMCNIYSNIKQTLKCEGTMISFDYIKLNLSGFSSRVFSLLAIVN